MPTDYPRQLLDVAGQLLDGRPTRASLHRSVSSAYYALFHLLVRDGARLLQVPAPLRQQAGRAFDHGTMKDVCESVEKGNIPKGLKTVVEVFPQELKDVAATFIKLQALRHEADYKPDRRPPFSKVGVQGYVAEATEAFDKWQNVSGEPAAKAFLLALLLHKRWDR